MKFKLFMAVVSLFVAQTVMADGPAAANPASVSGPIKKAVSVNLVQKKVVRDAAGAEQLEDAATIKPADIIEYRVTYTNNSSKPVNGLVADLPVPEGLEYQANSARPARDVEQATEDRKFGREPLVRTLPSGNTETIPYTEYRHIRWQLGTLAAGASVQVSARARVETFKPKTLPQAPAKAANPAAVAK